MSTKRKSKKTIAKEIALPLAEPEPPRDAVFRRKNRGSRLYLRLHVEEEGLKRVRILSARVKTLTGAQELLRMLQRQGGKSAQ